MKCYICKRETHRATRVDLPDKKGNWKFRDLCNTDEKSCYKEHMASKGYELKNGCWSQHHNSEPTVPQGGCFI